MENYFLSPRISAKTIELNGGVAFGAAIAGGVIGGFIGAFFALPMPPIQELFSAYGTTFEVVETPLTRVDEPSEATDAASTTTGRA